MFQQFIDREDELEFLEKMYKEKKSSLAITYGRRRIGKTELIKHFIKNKPHIYFLADDRGDYQNLRELQNFMGEFVGVDRST
jgi:AAA+ ATPase superfamily predicted ATPase